MNTCKLMIQIALLATAATALSLRAQPAVTESRVTTTTTSEGTIDQFAPGTEALVIRSEGRPEPLRYLVTRKTIYVDETGAPIAAERIGPGAPVTVHYVREGDRLLASRIVVRRPPPRVPPPVPAPAERTETVTTTTTTTSTGTIAEFAPGSRVVTIRSEGRPEPLRYAITRDTTYVDENGAPVSAETIANGAPVTVHYVRRGDGLMASRIVVRRPLVEERVRKPSHDEKEALEDLRKAQKERLEKEKKKERKGDRDDS